MNCGYRPDSRSEAPARLPQGMIGTRSTIVLLSSDLIETHDRFFRYVFSQMDPPTTKLMALLASGMAPTEIAKELHIAPLTLKERISALIDLFFVGESGDFKCPKGLAALWKIYGGRDNG